MEIRKVAESIIDGLSNLKNRTKTVQKMAHSYRAMQVEIVLNHLRQLTSHSSRAVKAHEICEDCREEFGHLDNCKGCPYVPPPAYVDSMDNKVIVEEVDD